MNYDGRIQVRTAFMAWLEEREPNMVVTFTFGRLVKDVAAQVIMKNFMNAIQRAAYGRGWCKRPGNQWPVAVGFFEHETTNPHYHVLMRVDSKFGKVLKSRGAAIWRELAPRGQLHVENIKSLPKLLNYVTKELGWAEQPGSVFIYAPVK
jgi:hypothetical protein